MSKANTEEDFALQINGEYFAMLFLITSDLRKKKHRANEIPHFL